MLDALLFPWKLLLVPIGAIVSLLDVPTPMLSGWMGTAFQWLAALPQTIATWLSGLFGG